MIDNKEVGELIELALLSTKPPEFPYVPFTIDSLEEQTINTQYTENFRTLAFLHSECSRAEIIRSLNNMPEPITKANENALAPPAPAAAAPTPAPAAEAAPVANAQPSPEEMLTAIYQKICGGASEMANDYVDPETETEKGKQIASPSPTQCSRKLIDYVHAFPTVDPVFLEKQERIGVSIDELKAMGIGVQKTERGKEKFNSMFHTARGVVDINASARKTAPVTAAAAPAAPVVRTENQKKYEPKYMRMLKDYNKENKTDYAMSDGLLNTFIELETGEKARGVL